MKKICDSKSGSWCDVGGDHLIEIPVMADVVFRVIEQHPDQRLLYAAYVQTEGMPLKIQLPLIDAGMRSLNEAAILRATLGFATNLAETLRRQLTEMTRAP